MIKDYMFILFNINLISFIIWFISYEINNVDKDFEIKKLKKIIKQKNNEIKELKSIGNFVYSNYIENKGSDK